MNLNDFYAWSNLGDYTDALEVVLIVSAGKLFTMSMGCLNNIITNSKYYAYVFWFSISSAILAVLLNLYLLPLYGIIGAAYATLIVIVIINVFKILLVQLKFKIIPYGMESILTMGIIILIYLIISKISFEFDPFVSLVLRSMLIIGVFALLAYWLKLTVDVQKFFVKILPFLRKD